MTARESSPTERWDSATSRPCCYYPPRGFLAVASLLGWAAIMRSTRDIIDALRVAAVWLLVVSVFFGPAGLGGSTGFAASSKSCGASCPCDDAAVDDHEGDHAEHAEADPCDDDVHADSEHDDGDPCKDECPDDCPNCRCCPGIAMAVLPLPVASSTATCTSSRMLAPIDAPASGACTDVFRPPRSLT